MNYIREKGGHEELFYISNSECSLAINLESQYLILPSSMKDEVERSVESTDYTCKIFEDMRMGCYNITPVDLSLSLIQLKLEDGVYINITLYDLRDSTNE